MKTCNACGLKQDISNFHKNGKNKDGLRNHCRKCATIAMRNYRTTGASNINRLDSVPIEALNSLLLELNRQFKKLGKIAKLEELNK